jgi:hypothetical protein
MSKIQSLTKTYNNDLTHDGYFVVTDNYPLKWVSLYQWELLSAKPSFKLNLDKHIQVMGDA